MSKKEDNSIKGVFKGLGGGLSEGCFVWAVWFVFIVVVGLILDAVGVF